LCCQIKYSGGGVGYCSFAFYSTPLLKNPLNQWTNYTAVSFKGKKIMLEKLQEVLCKKIGFCCVRLWSRAEGGHWTERAEASEGSGWSESGTA